MIRPHQIVLLSLLCVAALAAAPAAPTTRPRLTIKPADVARAKENIARYDWARRYLKQTKRDADELVAELSPAFVEQLIEPTTPLSTLFTPCPACRDLGKNGLPHGRWQWSARRAEQLKCATCSTPFPNVKYPETIELRSTWGTPQTFTFIGGETFVVFGYKRARPSISGCIRARKVSHVIDALPSLTEAFLLTGEEKYARTIRTILLRFAATYPHWLVHSGYGELADCDPRTAAETIEALPNDELCYPPNEPDRKLHTGFWSAGRATGAGQESRFVDAVASAYDATASSSIYTDAERATIEKDLLRESTILLVADKGINNKSVGNRTACAMVGLALDDKQLTDFGMEGFHKTTDEWFLRDGGTPESPAYAMMALNNTLDMPLAFRELFRTPRYAAAWAMMVDGLQGDCTFVPYADSYPDRKFPAASAELLVANYPKRSQYLALLKELCDGDLKNAPAERIATWYREPGLEAKSAPPLKLPDLCPPELRIGHLRTGDDGRESLLLLSASHWGAHHHEDSLSLYYWKDGRELLSDLGYLWDNPKKSMTARTLAHNTVIVNERNQRTLDRAGRVHFFKSSPHVKVMRASSNAYKDMRKYERTSAIIDHGDGRSYVVDFFFVDGGVMQDYVFHGPNFDVAAKMKISNETFYDLTNICELQSPTITWRIDNRCDFVAWNLKQRGERAFIGHGWGQRDSYNADQGATLPYVIRRTTGGGIKRFVTLFEAHAPDERFVRSIKRSDTFGGVKLEVETALGRDYIECSRAFRVTSKKQRGKIAWVFRP